MKTGFNRRQFMATTGAIAAAATTPSLLNAAPVVAKEDEMFKISLAQWSLHRALRAKKILKIVCKSSCHFLINNDVVKSMST